MKRVAQWIIGLSLAVMLGSTLYQSWNEKENPVIAAGERAPVFTLETPLGKQISLNDYRGKGVIINFWATFCTACKNEMPALERQYKKYKDQGVVVLGVNTGEEAKDAASYAKDTGVSFPILLDLNLEVTQLYQVVPLPTTVFVAPDGDIALIQIGEMDEKFIEKSIQTILPSQK